MAPSIHALVSLLCLFSAKTLAQVSNLPEVESGVFEASARIEISTTREAVWNALTDFDAYANWNPFVRSATATNTLGIPLPENRPVENQRLILRVQIPPLPLPVDASTPDNPLNIQFAIENVTAVQHDLGRLAWKYLSPDILLGSERWQAITDLGNGKVLYESREVFRGALSPVVQALYEDGLKKGFEEQAQGLKLLLEGSS